MKSTNKRIQLEWEKLMGFNQVKSAKGKAKGMALIGSRIGAKVGGKPV